MDWREEEEERQVFITLDSKQWITSSPVFPISSPLGQDTPNVRDKSYLGIILLLDSPDCS
jgi:hypothetical protein